MSPPILTILQKLGLCGYIGKCQSSLGSVPCPVFTLAETNREHLDCSMPFPSLTNQVSFFKLIKCIMPLPNHSHGSQASV